MVKEVKLGSEENNDKLPAGPAKSSQTSSAITADAGITEPEASEGTQAGVCEEADVRQLAATEQFIEILQRAKALVDMHRIVPTHAKAARVSDSMAMSAATEAFGSEPISTAQDEVFARPVSLEDDYLSDNNESVNAADKQSGLGSIGGARMADGPGKVADSTLGSVDDVSLPGNARVDSKSVDLGKRSFANADFEANRGTEVGKVDAGKAAETRKVVGREPIVGKSKVVDAGAAAETGKLADAAKQPVIESPNTKRSSMETNTTRTATNPADVIVTDVSHHDTLGAHTIVERPDGSRLYKNFIEHPDATMIEQSGGTRIWIRNKKPVSVETAEGIWSTNNGGRTWMHKDPSSKQAAAQDFRPWRKSSDRVQLDDNGNVSIKHKDGSGVIYNVEGSREEQLSDGIKRRFDTRGLLVSEQNPNGMTKTFLHTKFENESGDTEYKLLRTMTSAGRDLVERDAEGRPTKMWSHSGYKFEVGYDKRAEVNKISAAFVFDGTRKNLAGGGYRYEWNSVEGEKRNITNVAVAAEGTVTFRETLTSGHVLHNAFRPDGTYTITGNSPSGDSYSVEGQDGRPLRVTNPNGDQYHFNYDENRDHIYVSTGKYGKEFEKIQGQWQQRGTGDNYSKPPDMQIKADYTGALSVTTQLTADYYKVDKRSADGYQSTFTMDMRQGKWVSSERIAGKEVTTTIDTDSLENRAETTFNHKDGKQRREVRDIDQAGFVANIDRANSVIHQFGLEGAAQGQLVSTDGKLWRMLDAKGKKLAEFSASIDVHREGMTIKTLDLTGGEMLVRTDAKGVPHYFKDSSGEWMSKEGLHWEQDTGPRSFKKQFVGRPALPDGYPIIGHDERLDDFDDMLIVENGKPIRFSSSDGHEYVFALNRWVLQERKSKKTQQLLLDSGPARKK